MKTVLSAFVCVAFGIALALTQSVAMAQDYVTPTRENGGAYLKEGLNELVSGAYGRAHVLCTEAEKRLSWHTSQNDDYSYDYDSDLGPWMKSARQCQADALYYLNQIENACDVYASVDYRSTGDGDMRPVCQEHERKATQVQARGDDAHEMMGQLNHKAGDVVGLLTSNQDARSEISRYDQICEDLGQHDGIDSDLRDGVYNFCKGQSAYYKDDFYGGCRLFESSVQAFRKVAHGRDNILSGDTYLSGYGNAFYQQARQYVAGC